MNRTTQYVMCAGREGRQRNSQKTKHLTICHQRRQLHLERRKSSIESLCFASASHQRGLRLHYRRARKCFFRELRLFLWKYVHNCADTTRDRAQNLWKKSCNTTIISKQRLLGCINSRRAIITVGRALQPSKYIPIMHPLCSPTSTSMHLP